MARIFVTRKIPEIGITMLREAEHDLTISEKEGNLTAEELQSAITSAPYDGLLTLLSDKINGAVLDTVPNVKIVSNYAVGFNNIDVPAAASRGVTVTNTPGVLTDSVSEFALTLIMATVKRISEAERYARAGKYEGWAPELLLGGDLKGRTLGIVGAGRIGAEVAKKAQLGLGMKVVYYDIKPSPELEDSIACEYMSELDELMAVADVVSVHVPLLDATHHLINATRLSKMKSTAYLINTSRGPVVDEAALAEALKNNVIAGAGIDVFENEPAINATLLELENVVLTPHIASASIETRDAMSRLAAENLIAFFKGEEPPHVVKA
ncbi:D-glycerate dehydrogenase [Candidatus Kaiserbacteria bacterium]|nr:D-glycerate dehydrogenase [Candidatus Kaiserbacteria bacterium]MCB9812017.1 D-glycerate dehydrogenase [Candidatus Nomurabacteria bacterium]